MEYLVSILESPQDVAVRTDRSGPGKDGARKIEAGDLPAAKKIAMGDAIERIPADHLPAGVDPGHVRETGARHVDRGVLTIGQQESVAVTTGRVASDDIVTTNPDDQNLGCAHGIVNGPELATGAEGVRILNVGYAI